MQWREHQGARWLEAELEGAQAAFGTRLDLREADNRDRFAAALGRDPAGVLRGRQMHGAEVLMHDRAPDPDAEPAAADGQATAAAELTPLVLVADCLPIAVAGPGGVAMLHGGWRGLSAGVVERGVSLVEGNAAAIGPGIGPCCYEVGREVLDQFAFLKGIRPLDGERLRFSNGRMLDLRAVAVSLLEQAGVETVEVFDLCTRCNPELFYSHRREGESAGRQGGFVWLS